MRLRLDALADPRKPLQQPHEPSVEVDFGPHQPEEPAEGQASERRGRE